MEYTPSILVFLLFSLTVFFSLRYAVKQAEKEQKQAKLSEKK